MQYIVSSITYTHRLIRLAESGIRVHQLSTQEREGTGEQVEFYSRVAHVVLSSADLVFSVPRGLGFGLESRTFENIHTAVRGGAGAALIGANVSVMCTKGFSFEKTIDSIAVFVFTISDVTDLQLSSDRCSDEVKEICSQLKWVAGYGNLSAALLSFYVQRGELKEAGKNLKILATLVGRWAQNTYYGTPQLEAPLPEIPIEQEVSMNQLPTQQGAQFAANLAARAERQANNTVNELLSLESYDYMPRIVHTDLVFRQFPCRHCGKPVRYATKPDWKKSNQPKDRGLVYELKHLRRILRRTPGQLPKDWPSDLPFTEENFRSRPVMQSKIDQRIQEIVRETEAEIGREG